MLPPAGPLRDQLNERDFSNPLSFDKAVCVHEAAHAVVATALGIPPRRLIRDDHGGCCTFGGELREGSQADAMVTAAGDLFFEFWGLEMPSGLAGGVEWDRTWRERKDWDRIQLELHDLFAKREIRSAIFEVARKLWARRRLVGEEVERTCFECGVELVDFRAEARRALAEGRLCISFVDSETDRIDAFFRTEDALLRVGKTLFGWWCDCREDKDKDDLYMRDDPCAHIMAAAIATSLESGGGF